MRNEGDRFQTIVENLLLFVELDMLSFSVERLDEGDSIEKTLKQNNACIHNVCTLEYSKTRFKRAAKKKSVEPGGVGHKSPKLKRKGKSAKTVRKNASFVKKKNHQDLFMTQI